MRVSTNRYKDRPRVRISITKSEMEMFLGRRVGPEDVIRATSYLTDGEISIRIHSDGTQKFNFQPGEKYPSEWKKRKPNCKINDTFWLTVTRGMVVTDTSLKRPEEIGYMVSQDNGSTIVRTVGLPNFITLTPNVRRFPTGAGKKQRRKRTVNPSAESTTWKPSVGSESTQFGTFQKKTGLIASIFRFFGRS